jgi:DNA (cytosine-5)-methyltransferase 3A
LGWELFRNFLIAKEKFKPDFFLYENNKSAANAIKNKISNELGVPLQYINSALVSAQNRERFYAHNFGNVPLPADRGILLKDILESGIPFRGEKSNCLDANYYRGGNFSGFDRQSGKRLAVAEPVSSDKVGNIDKGGQGNRIYSVDGKSICLSAKSGGFGKHTGLYAIPLNKAKNGKSQCLRATAYKDGIRNMVGNDVDKRTCVALPAENSSTFANNKAYEVKDGFITMPNGKVYPLKLPNGFYVIRKLSVTEACRLQTMPDDYCRAVSATQGYKCLGNGWTAEVIIHLLSHALNGVSKTEEIAVISMYDGIGTGRYCFDKLGFKNVCYYAYEIDKWAIKIALSNYPDINECGDAFGVRENDWIQKVIAHKTG